MRTEGEVSTKNGTRLVQKERVYVHKSDVWKCVRPHSRVDLGTRKKYLGKDRQKRPTED